MPEVGGREVDDAVGLVAGRRPESLTTRWTQAAGPHTRIFVPRGRRIAVVPLSYQVAYPRIWYLPGLIADRGFGWGCATRARVVGRLGARAPVMANNSSVTMTLAESWAASSGATGGRAEARGIASCTGLNAAASTGRMGPGALEPTNPGAAAMATTAMSTALATTDLRRTRPDNTAAARNLPVSYPQSCAVQGG